MRRLTKTEEERLKLLTENSIPVTLLQPTKTGLKKSILDATGPVRNYLLENDIHDYSAQKQGQDYKVIFDLELIHDNQIIVVSPFL